MEKMEKEKAQSEFSCVEAHVVKLAKNQFKLRISNTGNVKVFNVSAKLKEGTSGAVFLGDKFQYDYLEAKNSFDIVILPHQPKFEVVTIWHDEYGNEHTRVQMCDRA